MTRRGGRPANSRTARRRSPAASGSSSSPWPSAGPAGTRRRSSGSTRPSATIPGSRPTIPTAAFPPGITPGSAAGKLPPAGDGSLAPSTGNPRVLGRRPAMKLAILLAAAAAPAKDVTFDSANVLHPAMGAEYRVAGRDVELKFGSVTYHLRNSGAPPV